MKYRLLPRTKVGKRSVGLIIAMPILFCVGSSFAGTSYRSVPAGETIPKDIIQRPALALTMLSGMACGVSAFIVGLIAILRKKEQALTVYLSTLIGALFTLFLIAEILFPHL